ncbi:reverse transcriptase domain-containing protein [Tanacetum coccineum]
MQPTFRGRLKRDCNQISYLETPTREVGLKTPNLICDYCRGSYEADECKQLSQAEQENNKRKEKEEDGPEWIVKNKFEDELANFMLENKLKKQKKDDEDERLLLIFKQIHINLPFLEAMIHIPKGAKVLKDLLSHKEKLKKGASSIKLSEECSAIIKRSLPQKEGDPRSSTLPCLIGPLAVQNALADLGASKFIFPDDFIILEMDEDELVPIILGRPFLVTARAVIDVHEGKLSLRVESETITFNIGKSMKSKHSRDDYLYCANHTAKLIQEQWVDIVNHDGKWTEEEEEEDSNKALVVSFYPTSEPVEPLEWKASDNRLKPSSVELPKFELKELPKHLEYTFL